MTAAHYVDDAVTVMHGDALDLLAEIPAGSVDAVVTDPPYGIGFMGHQWDQPGRYGPLRAAGRPDVHRRRPDGDLARISEGAMEAGRYDVSRAANARFQEWCTDWASECHRVLRPGGHFVSFGGARTWHRLAVAVEDAGFEIRDSIAWLFGQGFPKSLDVAKAIDATIQTGGSNSAGIRRTNETRPGDGRLARPLPVNGIMAEDLAEGRVTRTEPATAEGARWQGWGTALKPAFEPIVVGRKPLAGSVAANVLEHGTGALNVDACRVAHRSEEDRAESEGKNRHAQYGTEAGQNRVYGDYSQTAPKDYDGSRGRWPSNVVLDEDAAALLDAETGGTRRGGAAPARRAGIGYGGRQVGTEGERREFADGGASRYFPAFHWEAKAPAAERPRDGDTSHPTVKPLDLMRWLVRLVTPPGGLVLDPFAGSGTTGEACVVEGFRALLIEREAKYLPLIVGRLSKPIQAALL